MKCVKCDGEATLMREQLFVDGFVYALCDKCFNERYGYNTTAGERCAQCQQPLNEEFYMGRTNAKFCSKAEGVRAGIPDLFLAVPRRDAHGLFIEMKKAHGGRTSDKQDAALDMLAEQGYIWAVCHGWTEAKKCIEGYLRG